MDLQLQRVLDHRNQWIWSALETKYAVTYCWHDGYHLYHLVRGDALELSIPQQKISFELFTHELLRIYLQVCKNIHVAEVLLEHFWREPLLSWTLSDNLIQEVGRMLENIKIRALYQESPNHLLATDWQAQRTGMTSLHIDVLQRGFSDRAPTLPALDLFIYWFFATNAIADKDGVQNEALRMMKTMRPDLYDILNRFLNQWYSFDINRYHPPDYSYYPFIKAFLHQISLWTIRQVQLKYHLSLN